MELRNSFYSLSDVKFIYQPDIVDVLFAITIVLDSQIDQYKRSVYTLLNALGTVGGVSEAT